MESPAAKGEREEIFRPEAVLSPTVANSRDFLAILIEPLTVLCAKREEIIAIPLRPMVVNAKAPDRNAINLP